MTDGVVIGVTREGLTAKTDTATTIGTPIDAITMTGMIVGIAGPGLHLTTTRIQSIIDGAIGAIETRGVRPGKRIVTVDAVGVASEVPVEVGVTVRAVVDERDRVAATALILLLFRVEVRALRGGSVIF